MDTKFYSFVANDMYFVTDKGHGLNERTQTYNNVTE